MKLTKRMFALVAIVSCFLIGSNAFAQGGNTASDTGTTTASVISSLSVTNNTDLQFGEAIQQDAAKTIPAASGATFTVNGEPSRFYNITVPADGTKYMVTDSGLGSLYNEQIQLSTFHFITSELNSTTQGQLSTSGIDTIKIGATRAAIFGNQVKGAYVGTYPVTIIYQ